MKLVLQKFRLAFSFLSFSLLSFTGFAQLNIDTLAIQDFEVTPIAPVWNFTGPVIYNSGLSAPGAFPANSPLGIDTSRAWETTVNSGGLQLEFANTTVLPGYDSIRVRFRLAAMNLTNTGGGGPDNLDYVLVAYSTDGGANYTNRLRIRGALNDNSVWPYAATGLAQVYYQPASEALFQPINSGLQTTLGYSTCEIVFPGSVTQVALRITARSSSSTDTWMIDNVLLTGENNCPSITGSLVTTACDSFVAPSGAVYFNSGIYNDTIPSVSGCDSVITIDVAINHSDYDTVNVSACNFYVTPGGMLVTNSGTYTDQLTNISGCDSLITTHLTILQSSGSTISPTACGFYTSPGGNFLTSSGTYWDTIPNSAGCDSVITINLTINPIESTLINPFACGMYISPSGDTLTNSGNYTDTIPSSLGCDSIIMINLAILYIDTVVTTSIDGTTLTAQHSGGTYQWIDCSNNSPVPGATGQSFTPTGNGNYAVVFNHNGCTDTSACHAIISLGSKGEVLSGIKISPNPTTGKFMVQAGTAFTAAAVKILNIQGQVLYRQDNFSGPALELNLEKEAAGIYVIEISEGNEIQRWKLVKE